MDLAFPLLFLVWLFFAALGLAGTIFWIWMLIDVLTHEPSEGNDKLVWVAVILVTNVLGALIYFFVRRPERIRQYGQ